MNSKETKTIFFACGGLGMGNAARVSAIAEILCKEEEGTGTMVSLVVCTWGKGHKFLKASNLFGQRKISLHSLFSYGSGVEKNPILGGLMFWGGLLPTFILNNFLMLRYFLVYRPSLIVFDSDYHFVFLRFFKSKTKLVFLGQALDVIYRVGKTNSSGLSWSERLSLLVREQLDAALQLVFCERVIVPSFSLLPESSRRNGKIDRIPLIVRDEFLSSEQVDDAQGVAMCLSGSGFERENMRALAERLNVPILEALPSSAKDLNRFKAIIAQCGLSSLSECIALGKYLFMMPIPGHAEQKMNCREVARLGLGRELEGTESLEEITKSIPGKWTGAKVSCDGANVAVEILKGMV